tara:strand:- start:5829 stop:6080 length:252 start_codon:yes stop_codon:yes gene_type:complete
MQTIDWQEITAHGLLEKINDRVLAPVMGFRLYEYPGEGLVADNGAWEFSPELTETMLHKEEVVERVQQMLQQEGYIENTNSGQ